MIAVRPLPQGTPSRRNRRRHGLQSFLQEHGASIPPSYGTMEYQGKETQRFDGHEVDKKKKKKKNNTRSILPFEQSLDLRTTMPSPRQPT
jgi:hypothetical protein